VAVGAVVARIITQYSDKGSKAASRDINKLGKSFDKFAGKVGKAFGLAAAASAAFAIKIGIDSVKAAIADEKSQALLANSLRNTTGATDAAIAATEAFIDQTQRAFGEVDDNLRPALAKLASMTGSVATAQGLLGLALDVSAGGSVDLSAGTNAVTKALQGNYKALKNLGVPITDAMVKSKDLNAVLALTAKTFGGAAATRANTFEFRMKRLNIAFEEAKETLGNALMPVMEELFTILVTKVIPAIQKFLEENGDKLVAAFTAAIKAVVGFGFVIFKVFSFVAENRKLFSIVGAIIAAAFVTSKVLLFALALQKIVTAYKAMRAAAVAAGVAQAAATGGVSAAFAARGVATFVLALGGALIAMNTLNSQFDDAETKTKELEFSFEGLNGTTSDFLKNLKGMNVDLGKTVGTSKALTKEQKLSLGLQTAIKKLSGFAPTSETDPTQLEAARLNLVKQGSMAEAQRIVLLLQARAAADEAAKAAQRYNDILGALGDAKITPQEFDVLALKWGITTNAAQLYVQSIISIQDKKISATDIASLAETWGVTYEQAAKYLSFFEALNDGYLSPEEIAKLQTQWGMTSAAVIAYAAVFAAADDGKIDYTEIVGLADKWGLSIDEAEAYAAKILEEFGYDPSLLAAPVEAETAWVLAYGTVDAYKEISEGTFTYDPSITNGSDAAAIGWISAAAALSAYAAAAANAAIVTPPVIPQSPVIPPIIPPDFGNDDGPRYVPPRGSILALAAGGIVTSPTLSLIGEAGPEAVIPLGQMGSMGGTTINLTINGSVTSEGDLVSTIRNALLQGQNNGQAIVKNAILI
jgi:hypothetical protein